IRLAELEADVIGRLEQADRRAVVAPELADALILEVLRTARRNALQRRDDPIPRGIDFALALALGGIRREVQSVIDDREVVLVVHIPGVRIDLRVHADPELDIALELRRPRERIGFRKRRPQRRHCERAEENEREDGSAASTCTLHARWPDLRRRKHLQPFGYPKKSTFQRLA